jgi:4-oxalocrotonate tautomerase
MPEIVIHLAEGREPAKKRALMKDITDAVVRHFGVDPEAVIVQIVESKKADKMKGGLLFTERKPPSSKPAARK